MDFQLTNTQEELAQLTRRLCASRAPIEKLRASEKVDRDVWAALAEMGVFTLRRPEHRGGAGLGSPDVAVVFEALGRALMPGPLVWSHLAAALDGLPPGSMVGGLQRPDSGVAVVEHGIEVDHLLVVDDDGVWLIDPAELSWRAGRSLDPLTPMAAVADLPKGARVGDQSLADRWRLEGAAFVAAQLAGIAGAVCDLSVAYASARHQFGRPIGSFQAVKHILADMLCRAELARTQAYAAAVHLDDDSLGDVRRSVAAAKVVAGQAAHDNTKAAVQVHGGMGVTWEVDVHLYLKRAWVLDNAFGTPDDHADYIASQLG